MVAKSLDTGIAMMHNVDGKRHSKQKILVGRSQSFDTTFANEKQRPLPMSCILT